MIQFFFPESIVLVTCLNSGTRLRIQRSRSFLYLRPPHLQLSAMQAQATQVCPRRTVKFPAADGNSERYFPAKLSLCTGIAHGGLGMHNIFKVPVFSLKNHIILIFLTRNLLPNENFGQSEWMHRLCYRKASYMRSYQVTLCRTDHLKSL
jgi:hypothetical protein